MATKDAAMSEPAQIRYSSLRRHRLEQLYADAEHIALVALGRKVADTDPLAYWELVNWIVEVARRYRDGPVDSI